MDVSEAIRRRASCRAYRPDPVPEETLRRVLEAARLAPSACNRQPWRFAVVRDPELRRRVVAEGFLPGLRLQWALGAPALVVLGMERGLVTHRLAVGISRVDYPWIDLGIAGEHLVLAAEEEGLGTCWIGWVRPRALRRLVGWPAGIRPVSVISVGYAQERGRAPDGPPRRRALDELTRWL